MPSHEVVVLFSGAVGLVLDEPGGLYVVELRDRGATAIVPRGVWHTANVPAPGEALHITRGEGTTHRPRLRAAQEARGSPAGLGTGL